MYEMLATSNSQGDNVALNFKLEKEDVLHFWLHLLGLNFLAFWADNDREGVNCASNDTDSCYSLYVLDFLE